jgi:16S rRNA (cytosine967-C5)-methyltransferase
VPLALGAGPGERVLDACAAPGGKALAIADALGDGGLLVAADLRPRRMAVLQRLLALHEAKASLVVHDLARGTPFGAVFDRVLVDAPCTGLGTLRRDVDIRWRRVPADVTSAGARQLAMLHEAARALKPGGRLVYATCSSEPEENELVVASFLAGRRDFRPVARQALLADGMPEAVLDPGGRLVTRPDVHGLEAFFAAPLERVA